MKFIGSAFTVFLILLHGYLLWFLLGLFRHNFPAADDWFFIGQLIDNSPMELASDWYMQYGGRWFSYFLESYVLSDNTSSIVSTGIQFIQIPAFYISICFFIRSLFNKVGKQTIKESIGYSLLITTGLWFVLPDSGEFFTWLSSSVIYLNGVTLLLILLSLSIRKTTLLFQFPVLLFFSGTSELMVLAYLLYLGFEIYRSKQHRTIFLPLLLSGIVFFLINVLSPGSTARFTSLSGTDPGGNFLHFINAGGRMYLDLLIQRWWVFPGLFIAGCIFGNRELVLPEFKKRIVVYFIITLILTLPAWIVLRDSPPIRIMALPALALLFFSFIEGMLAGNKWNILRRFQIQIPIICILTISGVIFLERELRIVALYAESCQKRLELIQSYSGIHEEVIVLPPLAPSGLLYSAEITKNADHYLNRHFSTGLKLHYKFVKGD